MSRRLSFRSIVTGSLLAFLASPVSAVLQITVHEFTEDVLEFSINGSVDHNLNESEPNYSDRWILDGGDAKDWFSDITNFSKVSGGASREVWEMNKENSTLQNVDISHALATPENHSRHGDHLRGINQTELTPHDEYNTVSLGRNRFLDGLFRESLTADVEYDNLRLRATGTFRPQDVTSFSMYWGAGNNAVLQSEVDVSSFVPEPSAYALLLGVSGLLCVLLRGRKSISQ